MGLKISKKLADELRAAGICGYDEGREIHDPVPLTIPTRLKGAETIEQKLQRILNISLARQAANQGYETPEEAVDFGEDDDIEEMPTHYQIAGMEIPVQQMVEEQPEIPDETPSEPPQEAQTPGEGIEQNPPSGDQQQS